MKNKDLERLKKRFPGLETTIELAYIIGKIEGMKLAREIFTKEGGEKHAVNK